MYQYIYTVFLYLGVFVFFTAHYERWGRFIAKFSFFRIAAPSTLLFDSWDDVVVIIDRRMVCIYDYSGWATVMVSRSRSYEAVQYVPV